MTISDSDKAWKQFGVSDPYWAIQGGDALRETNLDNNAIEEFFRSGQTHMDLTFNQIRMHLDPAFEPNSALDFGCGVGRMLVPLSAICDRVVGVDISEAMLKEAERQCKERCTANLEFVISDDRLSRVTGTFDLVHSHTVFQHIPPSRGEAIFRRLVDLLSDGGIGAFHFTFFRDVSWLRKTVNWGRRSLPMLNNIVNIVQGERFGLPFTQMNSYNLNLLFRILREKGCANSFVANLEPVKGFFRMIIYSQKTRHSDW